jgi:CDP-glycerol glycerophosphotransferase
MTKFKKRWIHVKLQLWRKIAPIITLIFVDKKFKLSWVNYIAGYMLQKVKWWNKAEQAFKYAIKRNSNIAKYHNRLARTFHKQNKFVQEIAAFKMACQINSTHDNWFFRLGQAEEIMHHFKDAAKAYQKAINLKRSIALYHYRLGYVLESDGESELAEAAYSEAIKKDTELSAKKFGIGVFHYKYASEERAIAAFKRSIQKNSNDEELYYRLGLTYERMYNWKDAILCYENAIRLKPDNANWIYRLGIVLERNRLWSEAADAYKKANSLNKTLNPKWYWRQGYALSRAGQYKNGCIAFAKSCSINKNLLQAELHSKVKAKHSSQFYYHKGKRLFELKEYKKACDAFKDMYISKNADTYSNRNYKKNQLFYKIVTYTEYYQTEQLNKKMVLFESFHGLAMSCNPYAIFKYMLTRPEFSDYKYIWVINDKTSIPEQYLSHKNIIFVKRESDLYLKYINRAGFLINNNSFPPYFIRKEGQIYLNTWHGTPLKTLGKDINSGFFEHRNVVRNFYQTTHIISPNSHTTHVMYDQHDIAGSYDKLWAETGYPRIDLTLDKSGEIAKKTRQVLSVKADEQVLLYAPTYRGLSIGKTSDETEKIEEVLELLSQTGYRVLFRGHHKSEKKIKSSKLSEFVVPSVIDTNELLSVVDVLITDYSSIAFDFMVTEKPIIYYIYDLEDYKKERGLYFSMESMAGDKCKSLSELSKSIKAIDLQNWKISSQYKKSKEEFCPYDDGNVSKRVVDMLFFNKTEAVVQHQNDSRHSILINGGAFIPNGVTSSLLNLLSVIDYTKYAVTVAIDSLSIQKYPERIEQLKRLPSQVSVVARIGRMNLTIEEDWLLKRFINNSYNKKSSEQQRLIKNIYSREFKRLFGSGRFDTVIAFDGYNRMWTAIFAFASRSNMRKVIYMHSSMWDEYITRFPYLEMNFRVYNLYDALISVSSNTALINKKSLSKRYAINGDKFLYCDNVYNAQSVLKAAEEKIDNLNELNIFKTDEPVFITMGRLSPEKGHARLLEAFEEIRNKYKRSKLVILGDGPLRDELAALGEKLHIDKNIFFLGRKFNPFPYLKKADCFVMPSLYEGQGLVLLEAMTFNLPLVCTDFPSAHDLLRDGQGLIVENSPNGLVEGMSKYLDGKLDKTSFDFERYKKNALSQFYKKVINVN